MERDSKVLKKNEKFITRKVVDETILLPLFKSSDEIDCIYTLNLAASRVWELIDGKRTLNDIKKILLKEFDIKRETLENELSKLLNDFKTIDAVLDE